MSARVSPADQKTGLDGQVARVTAWATGRGITAGRVVTETGSALNGKRGKFLALLRDPSVTMIVVGHRDRFARFGAEYAGPALAASGRGLLGGGAAARRTDSGDHSADRAKSAADRRARPKDRPPPAGVKVRLTRCHLCSRAWHREAGRSAAPVLTVARAGTKVPRAKAIVAMAVQSVALSISGSQGMSRM